MRTNLLTALAATLAALTLSGCPPAPCCTADGDCGDGRMCVEGVCTIACDDDEACGEADVCVSSSSSEGPGRFCVRPGGYPAGTCPTPPAPDAGAATDAGTPDGGVGCVDDYLEPNNSIAAPTTISGDVLDFDALSICRFDEDFFVANLAPGEAATVTIRFAHAEGDLDLYAIDSATGATISSSTSLDDEEVVVVPSTGGRFAFRVIGWNNAENPSYSLSFVKTTTTPCIDDHEPNDTLGSATPLAPLPSPALDERTAGICSADDVDLYRLTNPYPTMYVTAVLQALTPGASLSLRLLAANGDELAASVSAGPTQALTIENVVSAPHIIEVRGLDGATSAYRLLYGVGPPPVCGDGLLFLPNEECDDGNIVAGDGCSTSCALEGAPCGNGFVDEGETCDDGNTVSGDGCSEACALEVPVSWTCAPPLFDDGVCDCGCGVVDADCPSPFGDVCEVNHCPFGAPIVFDDNASCFIPSCGDGVLEPPVEECDDGNLIGGDGCSSSCQDEPRCGNGVVEPPFEQCDDGNTLSGDGCSASCAFEPGPVCGNGVLNPGEQCDDGNTLSGDGCSASCTIEMVPLCGNGVVNAGEQCDDGNTVAGDGCSPLCTLEPVPVCGNGVIEPGEQCDDGNLVPGDGCSPLCGLEMVGDCGNGVIELGEQCDDGNNAPGDGCSPFCTNEFPPSCGNGFLEPGEQCDDGNNAPGDGCSPFCLEEVPPEWTCPPQYHQSGFGCDCGCGAFDPDCESLLDDVCDYNNCPGGAAVVPDDNTRCQLPACGNGVINGNEECDDGNTVGGDGCNAVCQREVVCGDGIIDGLEQCDDGNLVGGDGCSPGCTIELSVCGNGVVEPPFEQCDDGNLVGQDGCSPFCTFEFGQCGNGLVEPPFEQCDDGNFTSGDGCSPFCTLESPVGWTCPVFWYGDQLCDCGCGVLDVDCPSLSSGVCEFNNCPGVEPVPDNNPQCLLPSCGNGVVDEPFEQCDDGNLVGGDGCNVNCQVEPVCGDGFVSGFEQCDDGNTLDGDGCSSLCFVEQGTCGNGVVEPPFEQCDDGNTIDGDGCSAFCFFEFGLCGNGVVEAPFEQCDDGNTVDGDGCSSFCTFEGPGGWTCFPEWFGDGICDCGCGVTDVDCESTSSAVCDFDSCTPPTVIDPNDNAQCIVPACADDFFEENDAPADAALIETSTLTNAVLCPNDPDFFVFSAPADVDVVVTLQYTAPPPMTLRVSRPGQGVIDTVTGGGGALTIPFFSTTSGPVIVRVTGVSAGATVPRPYAITAIVDEEPAECPADDFEPNDEPPGSGPFALPITVDATICPNDVDFFTLVSADATVASVELVSDEDSGALFAVFDLNFALLATGVANGGAVDVALAGPGPFVVVVAGGAGESYALSVDDG